ncbi:MAG: UDP-N-acetylmuramoyl-L-alanyl-D-glutamate--2,6-diaminopimelate ligase, partial [Gammaproteobacteria bacterium]
MKLSVLCQKIAEIPENHDLDVTGLALDSRLVKTGYLFLACPGTHADGHDFIDIAIQKGAHAVLCEASRHIFEEVYITTKEGREVPIIAVPHLLQHIGELAAKFYGDPSAHLTVYGVTGTNGKTSVTHYLAACLEELNTSCAVLGTVGNGFLNKLETSSHTTPNPIALQLMLAQYYKSGAQAVAMEVSSHGLEQGRVNGVHFNTAVFTNLTRDHLDYHGTMEKYAAAKHKLFEMPGLQHAVINLDDAYGRELMREFSTELDCYGYTISDSEYPASDIRLVQATNVKYTPEGIQALIYTPWGNGDVNLPLYGQFNLSNILAVITILGIQNIAIDKIFPLIAKVHGVKGRMELLRQIGKPTVIVDYAHTPDALEKALQAIRVHTTGNVWCVFGCGGERDSGKRPEMGSIAEQYANNIIVTNDNPRHENPISIAEQIVTGLKKSALAKVILDRKEAIHYAISHANEKDVILIAGKGHENYQQIGDE